MSGTDELVAEPFKFCEKCQPAAAMMDTEAADRIEQLEQRLDREGIEILEDNYSQANIQIEQQQAEIERLKEKVERIQADSDFADTAETALREILDLVQSFDDAANLSGPDIVRIADEALKSY